MVRITVPFTSVNPAGEIANIEPGSVFLVESVDARSQCVTLFSDGEHVPGWSVSDQHTNALRYVPDDKVLSVSKSPFTGGIVVVASLDYCAHHGISHHPISRPTQEPTAVPRLRVR